MLGVLEHLASRSWLLPVVVFWICLLEDWLSEGSRKRYFRLCNALGLVVLESCIAICYECSRCLTILGLFRGRNPDHWLMPLRSRLVSGLQLGTHRFRLQTCPSIAQHNIEDVPSVNSLLSISPLRAYIDDLHASIRDREQHSAHLEGELIHAQTRQSLYRTELSKLRLQIGMDPESASEVADALETTYTRIVQLLLLTVMMLWESSEGLRRDLVAARRENASLRVSSRLSPLDLDILSIDGVESTPDLEQEDEVSPAAADCPQSTRILLWTVLILASRSRRLQTELIGREELYATVNSRLEMVSEAYDLCRTMCQEYEEVLRALRCEIQELHAKNARLAEQSTLMNIQEKLKSVRSRLDTIYEVHDFSRAMQDNYAGVLEELRTEIRQLAADNSHLTEELSRERDRTAHLEAAHASVLHDHETRYKLSVLSRYEDAAIFLKHQNGAESKYQESSRRLLTALLVLWRFTRSLGRQLASAQGKRIGYSVSWEPARSAELMDIVDDHPRRFIEDGPCNGNEAGLGQMKSLQVFRKLSTEETNICGSAKFEAGVATGSTDMPAALRMQGFFVGEDGLQRMQALALRFDDLQSTHAQLIWEHDMAISALHHAEEHIRELLDDRRSCLIGLATFYMALHHRGSTARSDPRAVQLAQYVVAPVYEEDTQRAEIVQQNDDSDRRQLPDTLLGAIPQPTHAPYQGTASGIASSYLASRSIPLSSALPRSFGFGRPPVMGSLPLANTTWSATLFPWLALTHTTSAGKTQQSPMSPVPRDARFAADSQSTAPAGRFHYPRTTETSPLPERCNLESSMFSTNCSGPNAPPLRVHTSSGNAPKPPALPAIYPSIPSYPYAFNYNNHWNHHPQATEVTPRANAAHFQPGPSRWDARTEEGEFDLS